LQPIVGPPSVLRHCPAAELTSSRTLHPPSSGGPERAIMAGAAAMARSIADMRRAHIADIVWDIFGCVTANLLAS
jgi:hypothetical protein